MHFGSARQTSHQSPPVGTHTRCFPAYFARVLTHSNGSALAAGPGQSPARMHGPRRRCQVAEAADRAFWVGSPPTASFASSLDAAAFARAEVAVMNQSSVEI